MFWREEDIQPAVDTAEKIFGPNNQYLENPSHSNACIFSDKFGIIWSGDIMFSEIFKDQMEMLSATINEKLKLNTGWNTVVLYETQTKIQE